MQSWIMPRSFVVALWSTVALTLVFLSAPEPAQAQDVDLSDLPPHPRFLLTPAVRAAMRAEAASGPKVSMFAEIKRRAERYADEEPAIGDHIMLTLFVAGVVYENQHFIDRALENMIHSANADYWPSAGIDQAIMYDWLYEYMTEEERQLVRELALDSYYLGGQRTVYYNLEANEATGKGIVGLAFYGDGTDAENDFCQALVDEWDGRMRGLREYAYPGGTENSLGGVLPAREKYFADGGYYKGMHYVQKDIWPITMTAVLFEELGLGNYWDVADEYISRFPEYLMQITRPDGQSQRMQSGVRYDLDKRAWLSLSILNTYRQHPLASWMMSSRNWDGNEGGGYDWALPAVVWRPGIPQTDPTTFPVYKFYGNEGLDDIPGKSYHEKVIVRTTWDRDVDNDSVYFTLHGGDFFGDYFSFYQTGFELYYRGALAARSGYYEAGSAHRWNYYNRAVANNVVAILDPTQEELGDIWGQDFLYDEPGRPEHINEVADVPVNDTADIATFEAGTSASGSDYYYAKAVLNTNSAYHYTNNTRKVAKQDRETVLMGRHLIVRDRVELSGGTNSVRFLLHTINEPTLESPQLLDTTVPGHIETYARTSYSALRSETTGSYEYDGKITVQPLLPANSTLRKVGGNNYECWVDDGEGNGQNFDIPDDEFFTDHNEAGQWRVETIAPTALETDFVHALFVGRPFETAPEARTIEDDSAVGCEVVGVGTFVFARTEANRDAIDYQIQGSMEPIPNILYGLNPSASYAVYVNDDAPVFLQASTSGGLTFDTQGPSRVKVRTAPMAQTGSSGSVR